MNILIIGSNGFVAKNLIFRLKFLNFKLLYFKRGDSLESLKKKIFKAETIFYLAGVNRETNKSKYLDNITLTKKIIDILRNTKKTKKLIFASSIQYKKKTPYGISKKKCEMLLLKLKKNINLIIYRMPNIFGKWAKPNYNSVVATFCHQLSRNKKIIINNNSKLKLMYIDDLVDDYVNLIKKKVSSKIIYSNLYYTVRVRELADILKEFKNNYEINIDFENQLIKKLYSTYVSYIPDNRICSMLKINKDKRGIFVEIFKNIKFGQFSFFSVCHKKTRGNHFHNTKTEKFLLISGKAKIKFSRIYDKKNYSIIVNENKPKIFITKPGDAHSITNIGSKEALFLVWSNEKYDKKKPDTFKFNIK